MEKSQKKFVVLLILLKNRYGTYYEAASALGIPNYRLSLILNGRLKLTEDLIEKLEKLLQCGREVFLLSADSITEQSVEKNNSFSCSSKDKADV